jgi:hypothetical protein
MAKARALDRRRKFRPEYPQDHSDDGVDCNGPVQEGDGPFHCGTRLHPQLSQDSWQHCQCRRRCRPSTCLRCRPTQRTAVLVLTGNRGLCGGYNSNVVRQAMALLGQWSSEQVATHVTVSGKAGHFCSPKFREITIDESHTSFEDKPAFKKLLRLAQAYLEAYAAMGRLIVSMWSTPSSPTLPNRKPSLRHCCL